MQRIGLISDTHGFLDPLVYDYFSECDEIWHAGDLGPGIAEPLADFKPLRGVYGNIDDAAIRTQFPQDDRFACEGVDVWITHIGGYPGRYDRAVSKRIKADPPDLFICGHSHILRVMRDPKLNNMLHFNPGAAGRHGFHIMRTMLRFEVSSGKVSKLQAVELGPRSAAN
jgi:putative phosphoesterase